MRPMAGVRHDCDHCRSGLPRPLRKSSPRAVGDEPPVVAYDPDVLARTSLRWRPKLYPRPCRLSVARSALASAFGLSWLESDSLAEVIV